MNFILAILRLFDSAEKKKKRLIDNRLKLRENYREAIIAIKKSSSDMRTKRLLMIKLSKSFRSLIQKMK